MFMLLFKPVGLNFPLHETESRTLDYSLILFFFSYVCFSLEHPDLTSLSGKSVI